MQIKFIREAEQYTKQNYRRSIWRKIVRMLGCVVVFCTTYALILPAITMEKNPCELEEHTHSENCYEKMTEEILVCQIPEVITHIHTDACYKIVESELTEPDETLTEVPEQAEVITEDAHFHDESCYGTERGELICQLAETEGHAHGEECYTQGNLICQQAEQEGHSHGEGCSETVLICEVTEEAEEESHEHTEACYQTNFLCELTETEGHSHGTDCYEPLLVCELTEEEAHAHDDACYEQISVLTCGLEEGNIPEPNEKTEENQAEETQPEEAQSEESVTPERELICKEPEEQVHVHSEECYEKAEEEKTILICTQEEHTHNLVCQNDPEADVETEEDWIATFADVALSGKPNEDLLAIARSQLGYRESIRNYEVMEDGESIKGYTRYGDWYDDPYGDWCAIFASFCLHYAGVEDIPLDSNCSNWVQILTENHRYYLSGEYTPVAGDLIFFDKNGDSSSDHVGIVSEIIPAAEEAAARVKTIEGDCDDQVLEQEYALNDETILGYGQLMKMEIPTDTEEQIEPVNMLSYKGNDYEVILRFDELAGIPANAELMVTEVTGEAYQEYLERTYEAMGFEEGHVLVQFLGGEEEQSVSTDDSAVISDNIKFARFFDITILVDGEEFEPADTVEVTVRYDETVEIPDGEKSAVHFTSSGEIEILNAEAAVPMLMRMSAPIEAEEPAEEVVEAEGEEFVFLQDSFSVTGTVTVGTPGSSEGEISGSFAQEIEVDWNCEKDNLRTLRVFANFSDEASEKGRKITIKVPTGYQIHSYDAVDGTAEISGVNMTEIEDNSKDSVISSTLSKASLEGGINGVYYGNSWNDQYMNGYVRYGTEVTTGTDKTKTYGGDIVYEMAAGTQTVSLDIVLHLNQVLLSHTSAQEKLEPIQVISEIVGNEPTVTYINVTATGIPVVKMNYGTPENAMVSLLGTKEGRTGTIEIAGEFSNFLSDYELESYLDEAEFVLTYPEGVFLEQSTVMCEWMQRSGFNDPTNQDLISGVETTIVKDHLTVLWEEDSTEGGGTITWNVSKCLVYHSTDSVLGAKFTANTDSDIHPYFEANEKIEGFSLEMKKFVRNGKELAPATLDYVRNVNSGDEKHIHIDAGNYRRRDITTDFLTDDYDYALGGFDVDGSHASATGFQNCTFYFENLDGLKITALNLMGRNIRNVTVVTNEGKEITLETFDNREDTYHDSGSASSSGGHLMELSAIAEKGNVSINEEEYIQSCLFTVDLKSKRYYSNYTVGSFIYIGQFQDGDNDGSREGDVTLQMLQDGTTYDEVKAAIAEDSLENLVFTNIYVDDCTVSGENCSYNGKPVKATDHTSIEWESTGVRTAFVSHKELNGSGTGPYYPNDTIEFSTKVYGGYNFKSNQGLINQDVLIDPDLIVSLPEGLTLDVSSVKAKSQMGTSNGVYLNLEQVGAAVTKTVDGVSWKTYRFRVPEDRHLSLVSPERLLGGASQDYPIEAAFHVFVESNCTAYDLDYQDLVKWDIHNGGYNEETMILDVSGKIARASEGNSTSSPISKDKNDFLSNGVNYGVATHSGTAKLNIHQNAGMNVDIAIKSLTGDEADQEDEIKADDGYIIYNGLDNSIASLTKAYAAVRVHYLANVESTSSIRGSEIYVPIPKVGQDYSKFFENINLDNPAEHDGNAGTDSEWLKTFQFNMYLTGPVEMTSQNGTQWETYYTLDDIASNMTLRSEDSDEGKWQPVVHKNASSSVNWLTREEIIEKQWSEVKMVKFVATDTVSSMDSGVAYMKLSYDNATDKDINYWRGYGKTVTNTETNEGNWWYTSVVAAKQITKSRVEGQIFIDLNRNGKQDLGEPNYSSGKMFASLKQTANSNISWIMSVDETGYFEFQSGEGNPIDLSAGEYDLKISRNNQEIDFYFANTEYENSIGHESPADAWHNNVFSQNGTSATFTITIEGIGVEEEVHRLGIAMEPRVKAKLNGIKNFDGTLKGNDFTFEIKADTYTSPNPKPSYYTEDFIKSINVPMPDDYTAKNLTTGIFKFEDIWFEYPGTYSYIITETPGENNNIVYDEHSVKAYVNVVADENGKLSISSITYDNSDGAKTEADSQITDKAVFTNFLAYALPETGGAGTTIYIMAGVVLSLFSMTYLIYKYLVRRREVS